MEATTPELGPVRFWSPKSSSFSGSDSIVVEAAKKLSKSTAECKQVRRSEFWINRQEQLQSRNELTHETKRHESTHKSSCV